jgi:transposase
VSSTSSFPLFEIIDAAPGARRRGGRAGQAVVPFDFLDLPSLCTLSVRREGDQYTVEAEPVSRPESCPHCAAPGRRLHVHDSRIQRATDVSVRDMRVHLLIRRRRYKCQDCLQVIQQSIEGINLRQRITERLREYVEMESLKTNTTFRTIADKVGIDDKTVRSIFTKLIKRLSRSWRFEAPRCLGIDEVYIGGVARCVLTDPRNKKLVNILSKRDMLTLRRHLLQIKHPERIEVIVIDMWRPYLEEALKRFPNAVVVIDKYHVLRMATQAVISVHRRLRKGDKNLSLPKIHLLRKRKHALPKAERVSLERRLKQLPELNEAHALKEEFFNIWNCLARCGAEEWFDRWMGKIPPHLSDDFKELLSAMKNWRREILNYFDYRDTNAFTESINGVIKGMQRTGRGYTFEVTRAKLLYGGKFSTSAPPAQIKIRDTNVRPARSRRKARRTDAPPNPQANVQQLKRIRQSEDEFNGLMRRPAGYLERFGHFKQLDFNF